MRSKNPRRRGRRSTRGRRVWSSVIRLQRRDEVIVSAEQRWGSVLATGVLGSVCVEEPQWGAGQRNGPQCVVVHLDEKALRARLLPLVDLSDVANSPGWHSIPIRTGQQLVGRVKREGVLDQSIDSLIVGHPVRVRRHPRGGRIQTEAVTETLPQSLAADGELHGTVGGVEQAVRADGRMAISVRLADLAGHRPVRALKGVHTNDGGEQRRPYDLAASGSLTLVEGCQDSEGAVHAGQQVRDRDPDALKVARGRAGYRHQPSFALDDLVVTWPPGFGPVVTEAADRQHDQTGVDLGQPLLGEAEPVQDAGPEVFHEHVGLANEGLKGGLTGVVLQIAGYGSLVPIRAQEVSGFTFAVDRINEGRPPSTGVVAATRILHLDHLGAEVAQHHRRMWSGQRTGEVDNDQTVQGSGVLGGKRPRRRREC